ncbi:MAG: hypothetical protein AB7Y46_15220 [Armatimonadota bacterium]
MIAWLLAAALLLAGLPAWAEQWGVPTGPNLVRNPSFEELDADGEPVGWRLPERYAVDATAARTGERSLTWANDDPDLYVLCSQPLDLQPGRRYDIRAFVRTEGLAGEDTGATICVEWHKPDGSYGGGSYPSGRKGDTVEWTEVGGLTTRLPDDATSPHLLCYVRRGMVGRAWWDDVSVRLVRERPLHSLLVGPYRGWITDEGPTRVHVTASFVLDDLQPLRGNLRLVVRLQPADGGAAVAERTIERITGEEVRVPLPVGDLTPGDYLVSVELQDARRESICADQHRLTRRTGPMPRSFIDRHNRLIIEGEPVFPLGMYWSSIDRDQLERYAEGPFNCLMPYGSPNAEQMDLAHEFGLRVIYSIKDFYFGTRWCPRFIASEADEERAVRERVRQYRDHPALMAWYLNDELPASMMERLEAHQRWVEEEDPDHPTWVVLYQVGEVRRYLRSFDVIGTDPYPIPTRPPSLAGQWTRITRRAVEDSRAIWMVPQAFNWGVYGNHADARPPTRDELRSMTWQCICEGADGLIYYSWFDLRKDQEYPFEQRWPEVRAVAQEVADLTPVLLSVEPRPEVSVQANEAVHWTARALDGTNWLILVNDSDQPASATVRLPHGRPPLPYGETQVPVGGMRSRLKLAPLEVRFLSWPG